MIKTVYKHIDVDIDIDVSDFTPGELINGLRDNGCPEHLIKELREWLNQPTPNPIKLQEWKEFATR